MPISRLPKRTPALSSRKVFLVLLPMTGAVAEGQWHLQIWQRGGSHLQEVGQRVPGARHWESGHRPNHAHVPMWERCRHGLQCPRWLWAPWNDGPRDLHSSDALSWAKMQLASGRVDANFCPMCLFWSTNNETLNNHVHKHYKMGPDLSFRQLHDG